MLPPLPFRSARMQPIGRPQVCHVCDAGLTPVGTVTRWCEWGSSIFTVVYTEGAMAIIIRVALPSSFRAASYHGGSSQLLILLVSAVRGAVPLRRRRSGAVSYLQLLHAAPPLGELIGSNLLARFSRCLSELWVAMGDPRREQRPVASIL